MALIIGKPEIIPGVGNKPKKIEEYFGRVSSKTDELSIARMQSPAGWEEPGQSPEFNEYSIVLKGMLEVRTKDKVFKIRAGQGILIEKSEWVQYSTPGAEGAEYIAVCIPAFLPAIVHRDGS
jgi:mannose-6-phosphate isomerase-like protein (cupin superfamily)